MGRHHKLHTWGNHSLDESSIKVHLIPARVKCFLWDRSSRGSRIWRNCGFSQAWHHEYCVYCCPKGKEYTLCTTHTQPMAVSHTPATLKKGKEYSFYHHAPAALWKRKKYCRSILIVIILQLYRGKGKASILITSIRVILTNTKTEFWQVW